MSQALEHGGSPGNGGGAQPVEQPGCAVEGLLGAGAEGQAAECADGAVVREIGEADFDGAEKVLEQGGATGPGGGQLCTKAVVTSFLTTPGNIVRSSNIASPLWSLPDPMEPGIFGKIGEHLCTGPPTFFAWSRSRIWDRSNFRQVAGPMFVSLGKFGGLHIIVGFW